MTTSIPGIEFFVYHTIIHVGQLNPTQMLQQAQLITGNIQGLNIALSFRVNLMLFEHCNIRFSEKQVKRIDENFQSYSLGTRFRTNVPPLNPPTSLRYLIRKFFSGDVSGDIGEALFAYFLIHIMNLQSSQIGHTRPAKRSGSLTPDFIIWDRSLSLAPLLQRKTYVNPLLAEVKSFTGQIDPVRISHALAQLQMGISNSNMIGLLFLVARNEQRQGYDTYLIQVEN